MADHPAIRQLFQNHGLAAANDYVRVSMCLQLGCWDFALPELARRAMAMVTQSLQPGFDYSRLDALRLEIFRHLEQNADLLEHHLGEYWALTAALGMLSPDSEIDTLCEGYDWFSICLEGMRDQAS
ncbi:hypothetical protein [Tahibacter amnicola]|uniref:Uncharacterized protein n=1 Tax=Tahibacter amnicola TaxID=2976241 RepID=A0ABY6BJG7_9GAMM|nr:hypothetical protein [Tahibacter amnicola]UXI68756.1 hypothetical protein N4264_03635 [Tahibacter amnicola]